MSKVINVYCANDSLFYNSQCLFVEFHDVLEIPWLTLIKYIIKAEAITKVFNTDEIINYDTEALFKWYLNRKKRNVFEEIGVRDEVDIKKDSYYDEFLKMCMTSLEYSTDIYKVDTTMNFINAVKILSMTKSIVKNIVIYSEYEEPGIKEFINNFIGTNTKVKYVFGDLKTILSKISSDSTFVFSDIEKVKTLIEADKIVGSTIMIPEGLRYNYMENDSSKLKVDLDELNKDYLFKSSFFDNFSANDLKI